MAFSDYNTDPSQNTSISSINIGENCAPGNLNNSVRQLMADMKSAFGTAYTTLSAFFQATDLPTARVALKALGSEGTEQVTGNLVRASAGPHIYHAAAGMTSGRIFVTPASASDPTSLPGDIWMTY